VRVRGRTARIPDRTVSRARAGDDAALRELVEAAYPTVRRWALVRTGHPADADDLAQDVLVRMIRKLHTFHGDARFESWLYALTRNAALDRNRRSVRARRSEDDPRTERALVPTRPPDPSRSAEAAELRASLLELFRRLPERQREVVDLVELQGMTAAEAGELMGVEPVSVRAHLFKARRTLRALILAERPELAEELP
jgi:RNA polymerase sigma-70 factor, ECF subfamily